MIIKLFGVIDFVIAAVLIFSFILPSNIIFYASGYLILKGGFFALGGNLVSWIDVLCGLYLFLISLGVSFTLITVIFVIYLLQKSLFSLM